MKITFASRYIYVVVDLGHVHDLPDASVSVNIEGLCMY